MSRDVAIIFDEGSGMTAAVASRLVDSMTVYAISKDLDIFSTISKQPNCYTIEADIAYSEERERIIQTLSAVNHIKYLCFDVGTVITSDDLYTLDEVDASELEYILAANLEGPIFFTQAILPKLSHARIAYITSGAALIPLPIAFPYSISKSALKKAFTDWKDELKAKQIHAACICPGKVDTPIHRQLEHIDQRFPRIRKMHEASQSVATLQPDDIGQFIYHILQQASDEELYQKEFWDIYQDAEQFAPKEPA